MSAWASIAQTVGGLLTGGGAVAAVNAVAKRRVTKADVVDRLSDAQLKWVGEFQEDAKSARAEAADARREAADARREAADTRREVADARRETVEAQRQMAVLREQVDALSERLHGLIQMIHEPAMTIERLRVVIPLPPPSANGRPG